MATNYTENYQLPIWAANDAFLREEFNDAHEKIEDARTEMAAKIPRIAAGSYKGTGEYASGSGFTKTLEFGFSAQLVLIMRSDSNAYLSGVFVRPSPRGICGFGNCEIVGAVWSETGLTWVSSQDANYQLNANNVTYYWLAIG